MESTNSLIEKLKIDYPGFTYQKAHDFQWSHGDKTIFYVCDDSDCSFLFHELSHALLNHTGYHRDVELIAMEREAWDKSKEIAENYGINIDEELIQSNLDTYRDWMHKRSTCPDCNATGMQISKHDYKCLACNHQWRVNDAKTCALRRYIKKHTP